MVISSKQINIKGLNSLNQNYQELADQQLKIAKGKKFIKSSDDPFRSSRSLQMRQYLRKIDQYEQNALVAQSVLESSEHAIKSYQSDLDRLHQLALKVGNDTYSQQNLQAVYHEVNEIQRNFLALANSKDAYGYYLFSGFQQNLPPVAKDSNQDWIFQGDLGLRTAQLGPSLSIEQNTHAYELFFQIPTKSLDVQSESEKSYFTVDLNAPNYEEGSLPQNSSFYIDGERVYTYNDDSSYEHQSLSTQSFYNAISANKLLNVAIYPRPPKIDLGFIQQGVPLTFGANQLKINGYEMTGTIQNDRDLIQLINSYSSMTQVEAVMGSSGIQLASKNLNNISIEFADQSSGFSTTFGLVGGDRHLCVLGTFDLIKDKQSFVVQTHQQASPQNIQASPWSIANVQVIDSDLFHDDAQIALKFMGQNNFCMIDLLTGKVIGDLTSYEAGKTYEMNGIRFSLSGTPHDRSLISIELKKKTHNNIFSILDEFKSFIQSPDQHNKRESIDLILNSINDGFGIANLSLAKIGSQASTLERQIKILHELKIQTTQAISDNEDLDMSKAISDFTFQKQALEAAQKSFIQIANLSLFKYL